VLIPKPGVARQGTARRVLNSILAFIFMAAPNHITNVNDQGGQQSYGGLVHLRVLGASATIAQPARFNNSEVRHDPQYGNGTGHHEPRLARR
jgi:hypothetical protein